VTEKSSESLAWCLREDAPHVEKHQIPDRCIRDQRPEGNEGDTWSKPENCINPQDFFSKLIYPQSTVMARGLDNVGAMEQEGRHLNSPTYPPRSC
jgi:hypothetical protein